MPCDHCFWEFLVTIQEIPSIVNMLACNVYSFSTRVSSVRVLFAQWGLPNDTAGRGRKNCGDVQSIVAGALALAASFNPISPLKWNLVGLHKEAPQLPWNAGSYPVTLNEGFSSSRVAARTVNTQISPDTASSLPQVYG